MSFFVSMCNLYACAANGERDVHLCVTAQESCGVSSVCIHASDKNLKNFADPHDTGQKGPSLFWSQVISSLWRMYFSPILSNLDVFYSSTPQLFAMQSAKENITLGVLMGTCTCSL